MRLELDDEEAGALASVLDDYLSDASPEIADTDNFEYRNSLKRQRDLLTQVRSRLRGA